MTGQESGQHFVRFVMQQLISIFSIDNSLMSNIQKLFSEKIEIFSAVEFSKVSVLTGIIKISLKVRKSHFLDHLAILHTFSLKL